MCLCVLLDAWLDVYMYVDVCMCYVDACQAMQVGSMALQRVDDLWLTVCNTQQ